MRITVLCIQKILFGQCLASYCVLMVMGTQPCALAPVNLLNNFECCIDRDDMNKSASPSRAFQSNHLVGTVKTARYGLQCGEPHQKKDRHRQRVRWFQGHRHCGGNVDRPLATSRRSRPSARSSHPKSSRAEQALDQRRNS